MKNYISVTFFLAAFAAPIVHAADRDFMIPAGATAPIVSCREGAGFNLAYCVNAIVRLKDACTAR